MTDLICLVGTRAIAHEYERTLLSPEDARRVAQSPQLETRLDWRVSRALKQRAALPVVSLSHSAGNAAVLCADAPIAAGVDMEVMKPRDFAALCEWVCSGEERTYLRGCGWQPETFYRLWCSKEALVKAAGLDFPADMRRVGYDIVDGAKAGWRVDGQTGWQGVERVLAGNMVLACVWRGNGAAVRFRLAECEPAFRQPENQLAA
ncbi:4'-phosphopantetheinyl transferase family protein [Kingella oralis]|uniref:4'-phosphopantetheinyl transferase family protein n=1 Tax=Kingella oralis TaxID=505 RepID=UPI0034E52C72